MTATIHGVNLGNWLVLEKWMSPNLFADCPAEDEYYLARDLPEDVYTARIRMDRAEWVTERDFVQMAGWGMTSVRIPVPYFVFGDRAPFLGCIDELDRAFAWAQRWDLTILLDLHTVPGSQNGFDNGGISGVCTWASQPDEVDFALSVLARLAERYGSHPALAGIEVLNEPNTTTSWQAFDVMDRYPPRDPDLARGSGPVTFDFLEEFYGRAYDTIRSRTDRSVPVVFHDGFDLTRWGRFFDRFDNVILDTHQYLMLAETQGCDQAAEGYAAYIRDHYVPQLRSVAATVPLIVGEWSLFNSAGCGVDTHGGRSVLNGEEGATGETLGAEEKRALYRALADAQLAAWNEGVGHYFWNFKLAIDTVGEPGWVGWDSWDLGRCVGQGWFPTTTTR